MKGCKKKKKELVILSQDNLPMKKEENALCKIVNFFKRIFGVKEKNIYVNNVNEDNVKVATNNSFVQDIKVSSVIEENETKELMRKYEQGIVKDVEMSKEEIVDLIELYNKEIERLKQDIDIIKSKIISKRQSADF